MNHWHECIKNSVGPTLDSCGTLQVTGKCSEIAQSVHQFGWVFPNVYDDQLE